MTKEEYTLESLNLITHDLDSPRTGRGKHARVVISYERNTGFVYARVDLMPGLRLPTDAELRKLAKSDGWHPGRRVIHEGMTSVCAWYRFESDKS